MRTQPNHVQSLGALRGAAAVTVVIYHALLIFPFTSAGDAHVLPPNVDDPWLLVGHMLLAWFSGSGAVTVFFVLSGTVLALSLSHTSRLDAVSLAGYCIKRAFRLYPLLAFATALAAVLQIYYFAHDPIPAGSEWMNRYYKSEASFVEIVKNALGTSNSLNSPAWTIRIELLASALFPFLFMTSRSRRVATPTFVCLLALMFMPNPIPQLLHLNVFLICFFVGACVPQAARAAAAWLATVRPGTVAIAFGVGVTAVMASKPLVSPTFHVHPTTVLLQTAGAFIIILILLTMASRMKRIPSILNFLGDISYGIYIMHFPILFALAHAIAPVEAEIGPWQTLAYNFGLALSTLALTVPVATLTYHAIERPAQYFGRRVVKRLEGMRPYVRTFGPTRKRNAYDP